MQISLIMALAAIPVYAGVLALAVCLAVLAVRALRKYLREDRRGENGKEA